MNEKPKAKHYELDELAAYFAARLPADAEDTLERHLGGCTECADQARQVYSFSLLMDRWSLHKVPASVEAAIDYLANEPRGSKWGDRLQVWRGWLRNLASPMAPSSPMFGLAAELRAEPHEKQLYDVILTLDRPLCRLAIPKRGRILAGVEAWPHSEKPPLVVLVPQNEQEKPVMALTSLDMSAGLLVARFDDTAPGDYLLCLEPTV